VLENYRGADVFKFVGVPYYGLPVESKEWQP
jgi:hypothetical protein